MALKFTDSLPSEQLRADALNINNIPENSLSQFLDIIFNFFKSLEKQTFLEDISNFSVSTSTSPAIVKSSSRGLITIIKGSIVKQSSDKDLYSDLVKLGVNEGYSKIISDTWNEQKTSIGTTALTNTLKVNQLVDMQWRFGVTASSSEQRNIRETFLQMKLTLDMGNSIKEVRLANMIIKEMSLPQFYTFLAEMEKAKALCDVFS